MIDFWLIFHQLWEEFWFASLLPVPDGLVELHEADVHGRLTSFHEADANGERKA